MDPELFRLNTMAGFSFSLLIGSAMWGITSIQIVSYYRTFKTDPLYLRIAVGSLWVCETMFMVLNAVALYDLIFSSGPFWVMPRERYIACMLSSIIQSTVQIIYAFRIYKLCGKIYIPLLCWMCSSYNFGACFAWCFKFIIMGHTAGKVLQLGEKYNWLVSSWFSVAAAVDVTIALSMCYILRRNRDQIRKRTLRVLDKLVLWTIQTGTVTSLMAVAIVATYNIIWYNRGVWAALYIVITTLYPLTMIALLNGRSLLRAIDGDGVDMTSTLKFEPASVPSTNVTSLDRSDNMESSQRSIIA